MPEYTEIILLTPDYKEKDTRQAFGDMDGVRKRIRPVVYSGDHMWRGYCAQDMFEVLATDRVRQIILPDFYTFEYYYKWLPIFLEPTQETEGFLFLLQREGFRSRKLT